MAVCHKTEQTQPMVYGKPVSPKIEKLSKVLCLFCNSNKHHQSMQHPSRAVQSRIYRIPHVGSGKVLLEIIIKSGSTETFAV